MVYIMFILVVAGTLLMLGVVMTAVMYWIWEGEQERANVFLERKPVEEFPMSKAA